MIIKTTMCLIRSASSLAAFSTLAFATLSEAAASQVAVSNLGEARSSNVNVIPGWSWASSFTTGSSAAYLEKITVPSFNGTDHAGVSIQLLSDDNSAPGSSLTTLVDAGDPDTGPFSFVTGGTVELSASTTYWIAATTTGGFFSFPTTSSFNQNSDYGWTIGNNSFFKSDPGSWSLVVGEPMMVSVSIAAVPEPSSAAALAGLSILGFVTLRRRRPSV